MAPYPTPPAPIQAQTHSQTQSPPPALRFERNADDWAQGYWLFTCASKSAHTLRSYRKEVGRWRAFLCMRYLSEQMGTTAYGRDDTAGLDFVESQQDAMVRATYDDAAAFISWIKDASAAPIPASIAERFGISPHKPRASAAVLQQAVVILHGMYTELCSAMVPGTLNQPVCHASPFAPFRKGAVARTARAVQGKRVSDRERPDQPDDGPDPAGVAKALTDDAWEAVVQTSYTTPGPESGPRIAMLRAARQRLIFAMLRATWDRRGAIASIVWRDIQQDRNDKWYIRRTRKGKGRVWAAIPQGLVDEIERFRSVLGRPARPTEDELDRSVFWIGNRSPGHAGQVRDMVIYREIKALFDRTASSLVSQGRPDLAAQLRRAGAGPHVIRHTMATQFLAAGGQLRLAGKILGHADVATTSRNYDSMRDAEEREAMDAQWRRV